MAKARKSAANTKSSEVGSPEGVVKKVKIQVGKKTPKQNEITLRLDLGKKRTLLALVTFGHT